MRILHGLVVALVMAPPSFGATVSTVDIAPSDVPTPGMTAFPVPAAAGWDGPASLMFDNSAAGLSFSAQPYPSGNAWVTFPLTSNKIAIHSLVDSWDPPAIGDASGQYFTNTQGSAGDAGANNRFPYRIPRPGRDCAVDFSAVYFQLAQVATEFGVFLPAHTDNYGQTPPSNDYNYVPVSGMTLDVYVQHPNETLAQAEYRQVITNGYCPFVKITDPAGIAGVVVLQNAAIYGGPTFGFMDVYTNASVPSSLVGDINGDGYVNVGDLQLLVAKWGSGPGFAGPEDISGDGYVNVGDLQLLVAHWGQTNKDVTPPAAVGDLGTSNPTYCSVMLTWTASGDDGNTGIVSTYDIRYSTNPITAGNFANATQVIGMPTPLVAGTSQSMTVSGLSASTTYYFAMKSADEVPNWSALSNVATTATTKLPSSDNALLTPKDFKYLGYYQVPTGGPFRNFNYGSSFTHRYVNGQLRFLAFTYDEYVGHRLIEFAAPASFGDTVPTISNQWPDIWTGTGLSDGGVWLGLWYEQAQNRLWTTWAIDYPDDVQARYTKSLAVRTLNDDGTISNAAGPWGLQGIGDRMIYGGVQAVPSWFQTMYGTGKYCAGWGGYASRMTTAQVSLGPTLFAFPEPTTFVPGENSIPTSAYKTIMDHSAATGATDWYSLGHPTMLDRGVRNCDVKDDYDGIYWQSPAPDGLGRWTWGDSNWNTGCWIETSYKQGFILVPKLCNGRTWYETSTLHCERQSAEIQVFDPNMLGQVAQGSRAAWNTYPTYRWQITDICRPLGLLWGRDGNGGEGGPAGATYDPTTQRLYVLCIWGANLNSYILIYEVGNGNAPVKDVAVGETNVTGTVSGYGSGVTGLPANRACTETNDGVYETITEVVTGGTSQLEQKWTFNVTGAASVVFNIKSYHNSNTDGDNFVFAYSTDGTNWTNMVTVTKTADDGNFQSYTLPANTSGTVYVRVRDTDRTSGHNNLDTIYIDEMNITSLP